MTAIYCGADQQGSLGSGRPYHTRECHHVETASTTEEVGEEEIERYHLRECNACQSIRIEEMTR